MYYYVLCTTKEGGEVKSFLRGSGYGDRFLIAEKMWSETVLDGQAGSSVPMPTET